MNKCIWCNRRKRPMFIFSSVLLVPGTISTVAETKSIFQKWIQTLYLEQPLSRTSLYLELRSRSLCVGCNLFFSLYFELSLSRSLCPLRVRDKESQLYEIFDTSMKSAVKPVHIYHMRCLRSMFGQLQILHNLKLTNLYKFISIHFFEDTNSVNG